MFAHLGPDVTATLFVTGAAVPAVGMSVVFPVAGASVRSWHDLVLPLTL
jgi:hypothetical protein